MLRKYEMIDKDIIENLKQKTLKISHFNAYLICFLNLQLVRLRQFDDFSYPFCVLNRTSRSTSNFEIPTQRKRETQYN